MNFRVKRRRKTQKRVFLNVVLFLTILSCIYLFGSPNDSSALTPSKTWIVTEGDTLWNIAAQVNPDEDPRKVIKEIKNLNNLSLSVIHPGQILIVPK